LGLEGGVLGRGVDVGFGRGRGFGGGLEGVWRGFGE